MSAELLPPTQELVRFYLDWSEKTGEEDRAEKVQAFIAGFKAAWNTRSPSAQPSEGAVDGQALASALGLGGIPKAQPTGKPIQRYNVNGPGAEEDESRVGRYVLYADHQAQLAEAVAEAAETESRRKLAFSEGTRYLAERNEARAEVERLKARGDHYEAAQHETADELDIAKAERDEAQALAETYRKALELLTKKADAVNEDRYAASEGTAPTQFGRVIAVPLLIGLSEALREAKQVVAKLEKGE